MILGAEARGFIFGGALAYRLGCGFVPARKPGKLPWQTIEATYDLEYGQDTLQIHADALGAGARVIVLDDVLATGGTASAKIELVHRLGGSVVGALFVIELGFLHGRDRLDPVDVHALLAYWRGRRRPTSRVHLGHGCRRRRPTSGYTLRTWVPSTPSDVPGTPRTWVPSTPSPARIGWVARRPARRLACGCRRSVRSTGCPARRTEVLRHLAARQEEAFLPIEKPAPPRPRRPESSSSLRISSASISR